MINPDVIGPMHSASAAEGGRPFVIGQIDPARGYVHVFDDTSLDVVMRSLDTITDFVNYLSRKEQFIQSGRLGIAAGEEDLLAYYLRNLGGHGDHDFVVPPDADDISFGEGLWEEFTLHPQRRAQIEANKVSYFWDRLIEHFNQHIMAGTQYHAPDWPQPVDAITRFLAREPRTRRRMLARTFIDLLERTPQQVRATRVFQPSRPGDPHYVFLLLPQFESMPYENYRQMRSAFLWACCMVAKLRFPDAQDIVGLATETRAHENAESSEDAIYLDARQWSPVQAAEARQYQQDLGLLTNVTMSRGVEQEYPLVQAAASRVRNRQPAVGMKGRDRNVPCPCGSGKKHKRCCG